MKQASMSTVKTSDLFFFLQCQLPVPVHRLSTEHSHIVLSNGPKKKKNVITCLIFFNFPSDLQLLILSADTKQYQYACWYVTSLLSSSRTSTLCLSLVYVAALPLLPTSFFFSLFGKNKKFFTVCVKSATSARERVLLSHQFTLSEMAKQVKSSVEENKHGHPELPHTLMHSETGQTEESLKESLDK